jgi:putative membrane protein
MYRTVVTMAVGQVKQHVGGETGEVLRGLTFRDTLAAERTFLAWLRTCLSLLAAGIALTSLPSASRGWGIYAGLVCLFGAGGLAVSAYKQWRNFRRTAAGSEPTPDARSSRILTAVVLAAVLIVMSAAGLRLIARTTGQVARPYGHVRPCAAFHGKDHDGRRSMRST